ncbi:MaoC family dehydratase N-terminal domain-containing protein [Chloroflexota bacterium]
MAEDPIITEELKNVMRVETAPVVYEVDKQWLKRFAAAIDDPNPLWQDEIYAKNSSFGTLIAPPTFPVAMRNENVKKELEKIDHPMKKRLNGGSEIEWFEPIREGDVITVTSRLADLKTREGKKGEMLFLVFETRFTNQLGQLAAMITNNSIWY